MDISITKLAHACLLVEAGEERVLIDPGGFTAADTRLDLSAIGPLDRILITHQHGDHCAPELVGKLLEASPGASLETVPAVTDLLGRHGITVPPPPQTPKPRFAAPHEDTPLGPGPPNTGFHVAGVLSHPGDSHSMEETNAVLALACMPPWGSATDAAAAAQRLRPSVVLPVHDWHLSPDGREWLYGLMARALEPAGIEVVVLPDFERVELTV